MTANATAGARHAVGIDLGTTHSAMASIDCGGDGRIEDVRILQAVAPGETERREGLPSFHHELPAGEAGAGVLPWGAFEWTAGTLARENGALAPGRTVVSAKSWLCHGGVDRRARILPWNAPEDVRRLSPVEASARYLSHMREAWNHGHPDDPLERQETIVAIPASFDEVARELTVEAMAAAGLERATLIEEPQAAFYAWLAAHEGDWREWVRPGELVLVCDVGGGTTDFTLIEPGGTDGENLAFRRVAVGEHLILGGDNLDLALARHLEPRLAGEGRRLDARQWSVLVRQCCRAKERLLGPDAPDNLTVALPGAGRQLIGGGLRAEVGREEAERLLVDGFLPWTGADAEPARAGSGFREFGLPYAADAGITRYLAEFLRRHTGRMPEAVLLNGGFFESPALRRRLMEVLTAWSGPGRAPRLLENARPDAAVARGAAYCGWVRRGKGIRIAAGLSRSYYVGAADAAGKVRAVCVAPAGLEEGAEAAAAGHEFELLLKRPVEFPFYSSTARAEDRPGDVVDVESARLAALPPMRTTLKTSRKATRSTVRVGLRCRATEIGTLETWCEEIGGDRRWRLEFNLRAAAAEGGGTDAGATVEETAARACAEELRKAFGGGTEAIAALPRRLDESAGLPRAEWPPNLLRRMADELLELREARREGAAQEARWLNLAGFFLRPGFGAALDDWRVDEAWKQYPGGVRHAKNELCRAEWWIAWRRIAGGLNEGRQAELAAPLVRRLKGGNGGFGAGTHETAEIWRLLGSLERIDAKTRVDLGERLVVRLEKKGWGADGGAAAWALGRIAARVPLYGPLHATLAPETAEGWLERLLGKPAQSEEHAFAVAMMARRTGDRHRDLGDGIRLRVLEWLRAAGAGERDVELVETGGELDRGEQAAAAGDELPVGLRWANT